MRKRRMNRPMLGLAAGIVAGYVAFIHLGYTAGLRSQRRKESDESRRTTEASA